MIRFLAIALLCLTMTFSCGLSGRQSQADIPLSKNLAMQEGTVPGMWGTTSTSDLASIKWPDTWQGARNLRAQWWKILAESPSEWRFENHAKGEPPGNTYFLWRYDKPVPEGTKILIEGDFPHARMMNFQVCAPWSQEFPSIGDGTGVPEISLLDEDIVPDPGHTNPYRTGANRNATKRHFHVTFELRDGNPVDLNPQAALPPYRASGNLRYGCTRSGKDGERGPYMWVRIFLPDGYDPYGAVEPPVIRLQFPGEAPVLAPITREVELNIGAVPRAYSIRENPALENGRSLKEQESLASLRAWAQEALANAGEPGNFLPEVALRYTDSNGIIKLIKSFGTPLFIGWQRRYSDPEFCTNGSLLRLYKHLYGMGPHEPLPGNDEHTSGHNLHNTYLYSAVSLRPGRLLVFQGKAPKTPKTLSGKATMDSSEELRYWGITLQTGRPVRLTPVIDIVDENVIQASDKTYMIVIGTERDRPSNASAENGITWIPWTIGDALAVNIRVMSTSARVWEHAPQLITWDESDYCDPNKYAHAVKQRMGEYDFGTKYMLKEQIEALGRVGTPPYTVPHT